MIIKIHIYILFALFATFANANVFINEIAAATSDRIIMYPIDGSYPLLGSTTPWTSIDFDDNKWISGQGGLGFGVSGLGTDLQAELYGYAVSLYIRQEFIVSAADAAKTNALRLHIDYDDGFVAFVNGKEIGRKNMGPPNAFSFHDQDAYNSHASGTPENIYFPNASDILVEGTNIIAIQVHNKGADNPMVISADLYIYSSPEIQLVNNSDSWNYFIGFAEPSGGIFDPRVSEHSTSYILWTDSNFDDSSWSSGPGGLGYGDGDDATIVDIKNIAYSIYIRQSFILTSPTTNSLTLTVNYDDGFIAYLNGYEIARKNMGVFGEFFAHNQPSTGEHEIEVTPETIVLPDASDFLVNGTNVLAIQTHNHIINSSDLTIKADLSADGFPYQFVYYTNIWKYMIGTSEPAAIPNPPKEYDDDFIDWVELYNNSPTSINLKGWSLTDNKDKPGKWEFPETTIPAGGYLVVLCDNQNITSTTNAYLHTNFKLTKDGEYLALFDNSSPRNLISGFSPNYPQQSFFHTYGWSQASNSYLYFADSSPGKRNAGKTFQGMISTPIIDKDSGFYSAITVSITITSAIQNAEIRYTTNGSEPNENSTLYTGALSLNVNTALRARAFKTGWIPSKTVTRSYIINANPAIKNVPIVSIIADWEKSIFKPNGVCSVVGGYYSGGWKPNTPDDYNIPMLHGRPYERRTSVDFFKYGTNSWKQIDCGIRIAGSGYTRPRYELQDLSGRWDQNSTTKKPQLNLFFRSDYGEKNLKFPLFRDSKETKFDTIRLRAGHNDYKNPFIKDEFARRYFINTGQAGSRGYLAWLFVNAEFRAFYNPCERYDETFFQEHYDSNKEWDIINNGTVIHGDVLYYDVANGDDVAFKDLLNFFTNNSMVILANYATAMTKLDVTNFVDYLIAETYSGNWDWPNNNWIAARERSSSGLFRFYVWDVEAGFGNSANVDNFNQYPLWQSGGGKGLNGEVTPIAILWRALKTSPDFRLLFADRIQKHYFNDGCMTEANLTETWNELEDIMKPMYSFYFGGSLNGRLS